MPEFLKAILLGIIQGLTEFLPVSSSGHLELVKAMVGLDLEAGQSLALTVWLHLATALSTIVFFRKDILQLFVSAFGSSAKEKSIKSRSYLLFIAISMLPAGFIGLFFEEQIDQWFYGNILAVSLSLLFTAFLLYLAQMKEGKGKTLSWFFALLIGLAQSVALLPGVSRSGSTISMALILGVNREEAARFSFLMVLPLILAKVAKDVLEAVMAKDFTALFFDGQTAIAFIFAFVFGLLACKWMLSLVKQLKLTAFAVYCAVVGLIGIFYSLV